MSPFGGIRDRFDLIIPPSNYRWFNSGFGGMGDRFDPESPPSLIFSFKKYNEQKAEERRYKLLHLNSDIPNNSADIAKYYSFSSNDKRLLKLCLCCDNIYNFAISCYLEMNERRKVIRIRVARNEIVDVERVIIDEPIMVSLCGM